MMLLSDFTINVLPAEDKDPYAEWMSDPFYPACFGTD